MKVLYKKGRFLYIVKYQSGVYLVSKGHDKKATKIDNILAQELLQSGYWEVFNGVLNTTDELEILDLIKKVNDE